METSAPKLPETLREKVVLSLNKSPAGFDAELKRLGCVVRTRDDVVVLGPVLDHDAYVFDATVFGHSFDLIIETVKWLRENNQNKPCYLLLPYVLQDANWDISNYFTVLPTLAVVPGARWCFDELLAEFSVRDLGGGWLTQSGLYVGYFRVTPLAATVLCVTGESGRGKTTLVRQLLKAGHRYHISSDFILANLIKSSRSDRDVLLPGESGLIEEIRRLGDSVWDYFFRRVEVDADLRRQFIDLIEIQLRRSIGKGLLSFDIDLRSDSTWEWVRDYLSAKDYRVWRCAP